MPLSLGAAAILGGSSILSGLGSAALTSGSAFRQFKYQSMLQEQAAKLNYEYGQKNALNSPTWNRQGLEKAGYNPMLAVQNSTSGANAGWTTTGQAGSFDESAGLASGVSNAMSLANMRNQTAQTESNIDLQHAQAQEARQRALNEHLREPFITPRERAELQKTNADINKLQTESTYIEAMRKNLSDRLALERELGFAQIGAQYYSANKGYAGTVYNADTLYNIASEHQPSGRSSSFKNYAGGTRDIMSGIGDIIHGRNDTYENYDESVQHSSRDKKTGVTTTTKSRKTGRRKK